jgi:DNA helicase-2/ATP-dependent DNA helicase PcrA
MKQHDIDTKEWEPRKISSAISRAKGDKKTYETYEVNNNPLTSIVKLLWEPYEKIKKQEQSFDFDDLLSETYFLLKNNPDILESYKKRWKHILVDEYQDTNTIQYELIKLLIGENKNLFVVGDGDQNIYSWRGADMKNILNFEKDFPESEVIILETNYRSTQNILAAAHDIISKNTERVDKKLVTNNPEGSKIVYYEGFSANQEASWVANQTQHYTNSGTDPRDIAILFRTNFQSRLLEEAFLQRMIPYQVVGTKFFQRKEIKDVMSYLRAGLNPASLSDLKRIINEPKRGIGKVAIAKIFSQQAHTLPTKVAVEYRNFQSLLEDIKTQSTQQVPSEVIKYIIEHSGFRRILSEGTSDDMERLENMKELVTYAKKYDFADEPFEQFLEEVSLLSDQDSLGSNSKDSNSAKLMTIHASKGLEFKYVFVVGLEQGLFPSQRDDTKHKHEDEEERRLCYVAFTRAKEILHVSYAKLRTIYGQQRINEPSEFLNDISNDILEFHEDSYGSSNTYGKKGSGKTYYNDDGGEIETFYLDF